MNRLDMEETIRELAERAKLNCWTEFVEELKVPSELLPILTTGRPELIRFAQPRELNKEEVDALYKLIAGLIETNIALREHASNLASLMQNWCGSLHGMMGVADRITRFAEFRHETAAEKEPAEVK